MKAYNVLSLLCALTLISGCLIASNSEQTRKGNYIAEDTFSRIEPGKTTDAWVKATLGEPSSRDKVDDKTEIWKWSYTERKESSGAIFLIFGGRDVKESDGKAYVEFKEGIVSNKWRG